MANVVYKENIDVKGILTLAGDEVFIEVEDYGTLSLADLAEKFDGELVTITIVNNRQFQPAGAYAESVRRL